MNIDIDNTICGKDLRTIADGVANYDCIVFEDAQHQLHPIYTALRTRVEGISYLILQEIGDEIKDGLPLIPIPEELLKKLK